MLLVSRSGFPKLCSTPDVCVIAFTGMSGLLSALQSYPFHSNDSNCETLETPDFWALPWPAHDSLGLASPLQNLHWKSALALSSTWFSDSWWDLKQNDWNGCKRTWTDSWCLTNFHSSLEKLPLVKMSASRFLVSTHIIWILGSTLIRSNNQSRATLWVLDTCLIVGLLPLIIIFITASSSSKMYNLDSPWEDCALLGTWSTWDNSSTLGPFPLPETLGCFFLIFAGP